MACGWTVTKYHSFQIWFFSHVADFSLPFVHMCLETENEWAVYLYSSFLIFSVLLTDWVPVLFPSKSVDHSVSYGGPATANEINYGFVYIAHPRAVTNLSWRKTSKYMPK